MICKYLLEEKFVSSSYVASSFIFKSFSLYLDNELFSLFSQNDEREQKARDFMRAEMRYHRAIQDLKTKQLQIHDHQKKFNEMQAK